MAYVSRQPRFDSTILTDQLAGSVSNPAAGSDKIINRSGVLYVKDSSGTETQILTGLASNEYSAKSADYTITDTDNVRTVGMTTSSTNRTVTLPTAADNTHRIITVKKVDSGTGTVTVDGESSETIDGETGFVIYNQYSSITVQSTGSAWVIIDRIMTSLDKRIYAHGGSYNGGNAPTITLSAGGGTLSSITDSEFMPYQVYDGSWRMTFNFEAVLSVTSRTDATFAIAGVTFDSTGTYAIVGFPAAAGVTWRAQANAGAGTVSTSHSTVSAATYRFSGDVSLSSKPTWAY